MNILIFALNKNQFERKNRNNKKYFRNKKTDVEIIFKMIKSSFFSVLNFI